VEQAKHTFTISYNAERCPTSARVNPTSDLTAVEQELCAAGRTDCVTVSRAQAPLIGFQPAQGSTPRGPLEIYFDPFRGSTFTGPSGALKIDSSTAYGGYKFHVGTADCRALDPEIIVTN
jgi:hypothetical protein